MYQSQFSSSSFSISLITLKPLFGNFRGGEAERVIVLNQRPILTIMRTGDVGTIGFEGRILTEILIKQDIGSLVLSMCGGAKGRLKDEGRYVNHRSSLLTLCSNLIQIRLSVPITVKPGYNEFRYNEGANPTFINQ